MQSLSLAGLMQPFPEADEGVAANKELIQPVARLHLVRCEPDTWIGNTNRRRDRPHTVTASTVQYFDRKHGVDIYSNGSSLLSMAMTSNAHCRMLAMARFNVATVG